jgi:hypothetical protein
MGIAMGPVGGTDQLSLATERFRANHMGEVVEQAMAEPYGNESAIQQRL